MYLHLHPLDFAILAAYLATLAGIGIYFSGRQTKLEDFFLARRGMSPTAIAHSGSAERME